ncbi:hypothetical protein NHL50_08025 [Acidimicrobiia bacterium EGI L10123]|uniref:hypothetical protein n=1 Tax=Salinilacustrithrix flava TaxID=2957203 RepID=UPI003D7C2596|nr:hypothetical protein [Acidimicrobiia bacterium EGI L10123]
MADSLIDRFGFGNRRAVANAMRDSQRREAEDRILADLVAGVSHREQVRAGRSS